MTKEERDEYLHTFNRILLEDAQRHLAIITPFSKESWCAAPFWIEQARRYRADLWTMKDFDL